jgi:hypothetical protein
MTRPLVILLLAVLSAAPSLQATPTVVTVRAVSRDAKVLGDGVGGARITIREAETGRVLASGTQTGGTGDTKRIMQEPRARGAAVYGSEGTAAYRATLNLSGPTVVEITAEGPLKYPQAMQRASKTLLLLPGRHIEGEGVLLEIAGFIVDAAAIEGPANTAIPIRARVTMTCGCPTEPGGLWNADDIAVTARILRKGSVVAEIALPYAGQTSTYEAAVGGLEPGTYEVEVLASDMRASNFGRVVTELVVSPAS